MSLLSAVLALAGAGMLTASPAAAQAGGACPRFGPIEVKVEFQVAQLKRDYGRSLAQLASMPGRAPGPAGASGGHILGLAHARYGEQSQLGALVQPMGDGTYCGGANALTVTFGFQERIIYVARELPQGSCIHREVLNHEMKHIAVDEQLLREFGPTIKHRLEGVLAQTRPVRARSKDQAMNVLRQPVDAALRQMMAEFGKERDRRQAQVDTVAEYERVSRSCDGEINRYIPKGKGRL
ncbi:hypothetical protein [Azospirillum sp. sgz302134]